MQAGNRRILRNGFGSNLLIGDAFAIQRIQCGLKSQNLILLQFQLAVHPFIYAFDQFFGLVVGVNGILLDFQFVGFDAIFAREFHEIQAFLVVQCLSGKIQGHCPVAAVADLKVVYVTAGDHAVFAHESLGIRGEVIVAYRDERRPDAGHGNQQHYGGDYGAGAAGSPFIGEALLVEVEVLACQIGGKHDEDGVDGEEVHCAEEVVHVPLGKTEAGRA